MTKEITDEMLIKYLLGDLPEEERIQIEEKYFLDDDFFQQLLLVEDELVDSYVKNELTPSQMKLFKDNFLATSYENSPVASPAFCMALIILLGSNDSSILFLFK